MINDTKSFIAGVQVGRRLKVADALRKARPRPSLPAPILTESGLYLLTETEKLIIRDIVPPPIME